MHTKYRLLHILRLLRDFVNVSTKKEPVKEHLSRLTGLHNKLSNGGYGFTDEEAALVMPLGQPEKYEPLVLKLEQDEATLTTKELKARLEEKRKLRRNEEQTRTARKEEQARNEPVRRPARTRQDDRMNRGAGRRNRGSHPVTRRPLRCFKCGKFGHVAKHCEQDSHDQAIDYAGRDPALSAREVAHNARCASSRVVTGSHVWYVQSVTTDHMASDTSDQHHRRWKCQRKRLWKSEGKAGHSSSLYPRMARNQCF